MKFILTTLAIVIGTYWLAKITGPIEAKRLLAQAQAVQSAPVTPMTQVREPTLEQAAQGIANAARQKGVPRQISSEFMLVRVEPIGTQVVTTYEFTAPIDPVNEQNRAAMRQEIRQKFRGSAACTDQFTRSLFQRGITFVQRYNYYQSTQNIITITLGARDCS